MVIPRIAHESRVATYFQWGPQKLHTLQQPENTVFKDTIYITQSRKTIKNTLNICICKDCLNIYSILQLKYILKICNLYNFILFNKTLKIEHKVVNHL